jgi:hypothetical protein
VIFQKLLKNQQKTAIPQQKYQAFWHGLLAE